jgi:hypothetical protein
MLDGLHSDATRNAIRLGRRGRAIVSERESHGVVWCGARISTKNSGRVTLWASELEQEYCMRSYMPSPLVYCERFDGRLGTDVKSRGYLR